MEKLLAYLIGAAGDACISHRKNKGEYCIDIRAEKQAVAIAQHFAAHKSLLWNLPGDSSQEKRAFPAAPLLKEGVRTLQTYLGKSGMRFGMAAGIPARIRARLF